MDKEINMHSKEEKHLLARQLAWIKDGNEWVKDMFGDKIKLSNLQSEAFTELSRIVCAKMMLAGGDKLTEEEKMYSEFIGVNIPAGMGIGKDFWAALVTLYCLSVFPDSGGQPPHVLASANNKKQLQNVLWRQIAALLPMSKKLRPDEPRSPTILEEMFVHQAEKVYLRSRGGKRHFAEAVTIPEGSEQDKAKALTGRHAPYMFFILDEASGMPECIFKELEGTLTGIVNLMIMIYNPRRSGGYVADAANSKRWLTLRWSGEEAFFDDPKLDIPLKRQRDDLISYGADSNPYRIRVLGLPPLDDKNQYIPYEWVQAAVEREMHVDEKDPIIIGVDPAGGGDETAVAVRQGSKILEIRGFNTPDKDVCLQRILEVCSVYDPACIVLDALYNGWYLTEKLEKLGYNVVPILSQSSARNQLLYKNIREEMWETAKEHFRRGTISLPNDVDLIDQYSSIRGFEFIGGRLKLPSKKQMKTSAMIGKSPDRADAVNLTYAIDDNMFRKVKNPWLPKKDPEIPLFAKRSNITGY